MDNFLISFKVKIKVDNNIVVVVVRGREREKKMILVVKINDTRKACEYTNQTHIDVAQSVCTGRNIRKKRKRVD